MFHKCLINASYMFAKWFIETLEYLALRSERYFTCGQAGYSSYEHLEARARKYCRAARDCPIPCTATSPVGS